MTATISLRPGARRGAIDQDLGLVAVDAREQAGRMDHQGRCRVFGMMQRIETIVESHDDPFVE
jgi:hypothetical protein